MLLTALHNASISGPYGQRRLGRIHRGLDLKVPTGTPVYAAKDGVIAQVAYGLPVNDKSTKNGNFVRINYDDGTQGVYLHLEHVDVSVRTEGTGVDAGDQIGTSNNTGSSRGAHLHYHLYEDTDRQETIDPTLEYGNCG